MKPFISLKLSIAVCALLLCGGAHAQTTPPQQIHVLTLLGRPVQFVVADKQGLFAKYGIEVVNDNKKNSDELRADLAAGKGDVAYLAVDNAVAMVELAHQDVVIVMGGEGNGLHELTRKRCDFLVSLPTNGPVKSLNVSVATGVVLFEALRQRHGKPTQ